MKLVNLVSVVVLLFMVAVGTLVWLVLRYFL